MIRLHWILLTICLVQDVKSVHSADLQQSSPSGLTGIVLTNADNFPVIAAILENSPADRHGSLRPGDIIVSVSQGSSTSRFFTTEGMSINAVATLLKGEPGSEVTINVKRYGAVAETNAIIRLRRVEPLKLQLTGGRTALGFPGGESTLKSPPMEIPSDISIMRRLSPKEWASVTNGMSSNDVVHTIGSPLKITKGLRPEVWSLQYGWLIHTGGQKFDISPAVIVLTNGIVEDLSTVLELESVANCTVEILSRP